MAGSLKPPQRVKLLVIVALFWCCLARGYDISGWSLVALMLLSIIIIIIITVKRGAPDPPTATRLPGHEREKLAGSLHWRENKWGSRGLEVGQACSGIPHLRPSLWARSGFCRSVSTSSITWSSASPDRHRLLQVYWERQQNAVMFLFFLFPSLFCFLPAFFNIVYILCIIAFGASSFYSFLYQKCTTLLSSFELLECCLFQMGKLSKEKDTHCALFFIWSVYFLQDVEIARSFTERVHPSRLWCCSWFMKKLTVGAALSQICYLLILDSSCRMFIVQCRQFTACTHFITHGFLKHWS